MQSNQNRKQKKHKKSNSLIFCKKNVFLSSLVKVLRLWILKEGKIQKNTEKNYSRIQICDKINIENKLYNNWEKEKYLTGNWTYL